MAFDYEPLIICEVKIEYFLKELSTRLKKVEEMTQAYVLGRAKLPTLSTTGQLLSEIALYELEQTIPELYSEIESLKTGLDVLSSKKQAVEKDLDIQARERGITKSQLSKIVDPLYFQEKSKFRKPAYKLTLSEKDFRNSEAREFEEARNYARLIKAGYSESQALEQSLEIEHPISVTITQSFQMPKQNPTD